MSATNSISRAQSKAKERVAIHARMEDRKPSIQGKLPRQRRRRRLTAIRKPRWDDSVAGRTLPPSHRELNAPTANGTTAATSSRKASSRLYSQTRTTEVIDRCDGSPTLTRQVRSIICKDPSIDNESSEPLTKNAATSPVNTTSTRTTSEPFRTMSTCVTAIQSREDEALAKLEKHLLELETLEDMIRLHIDDGMSVLEPDEYFDCSDCDNSGSLEEDAEQDVPIAVPTAASGPPFSCERDIVTASLTKTNTIGNGVSRSAHSHVHPTSRAALEVPAPLNIGLEEGTEARLIRSSQANQCCRRRIIEEPFERTGLPAHIVIERAVEVIINDEMKRLADEIYHDAPLSRDLIAKAFLPTTT